MSLIPAFKIGLWNAWIFMLWPWIDTLAFRLVGKEVFQRASGLAAEMKTGRVYKIISYVSMIIELLAVVYSVFLPFKLGMIWFYTGLTVFILGLIINIAATIDFVTTPIREPVIKGIYRYSWHPMYLAMLLIYLGVGIAAASWVFLFVTVVWLVLIRLSVGEEEYYCLQKYGDSYRDYMNRTPRWIGIPKS